MRVHWVGLLYRLRGQLPRRGYAAIINRINPRRDRYLIPTLSFDGLIERLNARSIEYVMLGGVPKRLELLISDADLDRVRDLVTMWPIGIPVSIYTPSARPGAVVSTDRLIRPRGGVNLTALLNRFETHWVNEPSWPSTGTSGAASAAPLSLRTSA